VGVVGPITRSRINQLLADGAGNSGKVPPGLLIASGIAEKLGGAPGIPEGQTLPRGIAKKLGIPTDDDNGEGDTTDPEIASLLPADDATGVAVGVDLDMTFSEVVVLGTGNITLKRGDDDSSVEEFAASSTTGTGTNVIMVNPSADLATSTEYYILVDAGAFVDGSGNQFAGISAT